MKLDPTSKYLYKIISPENWQKSQLQNILVTPPMDDEFIHLSTEEQLPGIIRKFWDGKDYIVLQLDVTKIQGRLIHECNPGGSTLYYHLYEGSIPMDSIIQPMIVRLS
jgi:uncharacterized protein (DUF952 family)